MTDQTNAEKIKAFHDAELIPPTHLVEGLLADYAKAVAEQDGDVRAVAALLDANDMAVSPSLFASAWENLATRFADRIAELNARDTKDGEQQ